MRVGRWMKTLFFRCRTARKTDTCHFVIDHFVFPQFPQVIHDPSGLGEATHRPPHQELRLPPGRGQELHTHLHLQRLELLFGQVKAWQKMQNDMFFS